jgi:glutathione peroxidase
VSGLHDFVLPALEGPPIRFGAWAGAPVLLVAVPDRGAHAERHRALEALWQRFHGRGLRMVGLLSPPRIPVACGSPADLTSVRHGPSFPITAPLELVGPARHSLARWLTGPGSPFPGEPRADFEKFLCDGGGRLVGRYPGALEELAPELLAALEVFLP